MRAVETRCCEIRPARAGSRANTTSGRPERDEVCSPRGRSVATATQCKELHTQVSVSQTLWYMNNERILPACHQKKDT